MNTNDTIIINPVNTSGGGEILNDVVIPSTYSASTLSTSSSFNVLIDGDYTLSPISRTPPIDSMYYYARDHIPSYSSILTYPNEPEYNPNTNGVTNFNFSFYGMSYCADTIGSIMNRFDWNSCLGMSYAFAFCYNLTGSIPNIPNNTVNISMAFYYCNKLTGSLPKIPNSVTNLSSTFSYCRNLTGSIPNIPNSVTDMRGTFSGCFNLTGTIPNIPNSVTDMSGAFSNCTNLTGSIPEIPNSVTDMSYAFSNCTNLSGTISNIGSNVTNMYYAFYNCRKLQSSKIYIHSNKVREVRSCFTGILNTMSIYVHYKTETYNAFYKAMGNSTYNSSWKCYLRIF